jgi:hypothetical protein
MSRALSSLNNGFLVHETIPTTYPYHLVLPTPIFIIDILKSVYCALLVFFKRARVGGWLVPVREFWYTTSVCSKSSRPARYQGNS